MVHKKFCNVIEKSWRDREKTDYPRDAVQMAVSENGVYRIPSKGKLNRGK